MGKCRVCRKKTANTCSACGVFYCNEQCQIVDWFALHQEECGLVGGKSEDRDRSPKRESVSPRPLMQTSPPPTTNVPQPRGGRTFAWFFKWLSKLKGNAEVATTLKQLESGKSESVRRLKLSASCSSLEVFVQTLIGSGSYGKVFTACRGTAGQCSRPENFKLVIKLQILETLEARANFNSDVKYTRIASNYDIGPRLIYSCDSREIGELFDLMEEEKSDFAAGTRIGIQILERWDMDLFHLQESGWLSEETAIGIENIEFVFSQIQSKRSRLHAEGVVHADLKMPNVLVNIDDEYRVTKVCLADFGLSFSFSEKRDVEKWLEKRRDQYGEHIFTYYPLLTTSLFGLIDPAVLEFKKAIEQASADSNWEPAEAMFLDDPTLLDRFMF